MSVPNSEYFEVAYVCRHCGWPLSYEMLAANGGVAYCCRSGESEGAAR